MEVMDKSREGLRRKKSKLSKKKSLIRFNQKKLIKGFAMYKNKNDFSPKNSTHEFEFYRTVSKSFDWKKKTQEEIEDMKQDIQWKAIEGIEQYGVLDKPEMKKVFWKTKKMDNDAYNCDEMWTFSSKNCPKHSRVDLNSIDNQNMLDQERIFWKTSKLSLPVAFYENKDNSVQNQNMLWRSLKHLQRFYEDNFVDVHHFSEIFNVELQRIAEGNALEIVRGCVYNKNEPMLRKARLSRWTFLRHDDNFRNVPANQVKQKGNPYSRFFVRKNSKEESAGKSIGDEICHWKDFEECDSSESCESCNCSCCSCEKCIDELNGNSSMDTVKQLSEEEMAPNSEEDPQIAFQSKRTWGMDCADKEPLRPPVYNPEDYATSLKKWGRKSNNGIQLPLYLSQSTGSIERISSELTLQNKRQSSPSTKSSSSIKSGDEKQSKKDKELTLKMEKKDLKNKENINRGLKNELSKDFRNPILTLSTQEGEMSLRQFSSVTELLGKLKVDLKLAFPSFVQEFVGDPVDGVTLLLELLRAVQLSQASQQQRCPPQVLRRALLDEHSCLVCLKHCLRCSDATRRLASSPAGLFTLAVCIMSNVTKSRIIALELLTKACEPPANGHKAVSEALSTLRLRFGEPVRFRFLVGMLNSAGAVELLATAMKFINVFLETAPNIQQKVYIQGELEQAGFDAKVLRRTLPCNSESVKVELTKWEKNYFDVEVLQNKVVEVNSLQEKILLLEKKVQILQEEKGILQSLEQCLKERCSELEEEVSIKTTTTTKSPPTKPFRNYTIQQNKRNTEKGESTPAEDEGISSSEQELSQDEDYVKGAIPYNNDKEQIAKESRNVICSGNEVNRAANKGTDNKIANRESCKNMKNIRSNKMKETNVDDGNEIIRNDCESNEEEETTIDEVIEELENIVNDAETEAYADEQKMKAAEVKTKPPNPNYKKLGEEKVEEKPRVYTRNPQCTEKEIFEESEIVPSILHPQPPRKAKSLVHIYFPGRDFDSHEHIKSEFFDEDTDSESSDSLLTAAREKRAIHKNCHRSLEVSDSFNSFSSVNTRTLFIKQEEEYDSELNVKLGYEERNIDEEEIKRKHLKNNMQFKQERNTKENFSSQPMYKEKRMAEGQKKTNELIKNSSMERIDGNYSSPYEKSTSFQGIKSCIADKLLNESPYTRRAQKFVPTPVKRSQTFHITSSEGDKQYKRTDIKPKPKMGVSGLDFQRSMDQKAKNDQGKYQSTEYKKNSDRKTDASDRYSKRISKDVQKPYENDNRDHANIPLLRRGSFDGLFSVIETKDNHVSRISKTESTTPSFYTEITHIIEKLPAKMRSKSLEKMDEGLDSLVDIVISPDETKKPKARSEWNVEVSKNIGPRTRRSLAESSLFTQQYTKNKLEEPPKPPKPAQRTSLTRNNSSSTPLHLPIEIKLAPVQPKPQQQIVYNFGLKQAKSEDSLLSASPSKRYPPDGSSSPKDFKGNNYEAQKFSDEKSPIYSQPLKPSKLQKFFGNPKFENSTGSDTGSNQKYFESNYACTTASPEKPISPMPRNIQNIANSTTQRVKNLMASSNQQKQPTNNYKPPGKEQQTSSKPNFLLGTYQSQSSKNNIPKQTGGSSVLNSINNFNNSFLTKRTNSSTKIYPGSRKNSSGYNSPSNNERTPENSRQQSPGSGIGSEKVTDSPSGLY